MLFQRVESSDYGFIRWITILNIRFVVALC